MLYFIIKLCFILIFFLGSTQSDEKTVEEIEKLEIENKIVNFHNFNYTLNPHEYICNDEDIFLLVYVHSAPQNFKRRIAVRETWSNVFKDMRVVFMVGDTEDKALKSLLKYEYSLYMDLVQQNFIDSYRNLTYKGIMALKWSSEYCSNVKYILKVDDDIIVNIFLFWWHLKKLDEHKMLAKKTILCNVWTKMKVIRDEKSKWYLSKDDFKPNYFGNYCSGSAFLLTNELARDMYNASKYIKFFWVDDYYVSGQLARAANAEYYRFNEFYSIRATSVEQKFKDSNTLIFGHTSKQKNIFYTIWNHIFQEQLILIPKLSIDLQNEIKSVISRDFWWSKDIFSY